jgi:hypothetical protein
MRPKISLQARFYADAPVRPAASPVPLSPSTANPFSDVCAFVQDEQAWATPRGLRKWPRAFLSRDGWVEWSISEGAW